MCDSKNQRPQQEDDLSKKTASSHMEDDLSKKPPIGHVEMPGGNGDASNRGRTGVSRASAFPLPRGIAKAKRPPCSTARSIFSMTRRWSSDHFR